MYFLFSAEESAGSSLVSNSATEKENKLARVLFDWVKDEGNENEINLVKGSQVMITSQVDPDWWYGKTAEGSTEGWVYRLYIFGV